MMDLDGTIELAECLRYVELASVERPFAQWEPGDQPTALLVPEGFEERSLGVLQNLADRRIRVPRIVIGRYVNDPDLNKDHRPRFEALANELAPGAWEVIKNRDNGVWVQEALDRVQEPSVALDITGLSNRGLFGALDALAAAKQEVLILYSEAVQYWPKRQDWERIRKGLASDYVDEVAERADESEWLYSGRNFHVELIEHHEGYDVAGTSTLVAFLPFKRGRLAAVMSHAEYSEYLFVAGRPRLQENAWRLDALKKINGLVTRDWRIEEIGTFGYREALKQLATLLFSIGGLSYRCDIHIAPFGSKLQTIACWALSRITGAVTMVTGIPSRYYPQTYSEGIGVSWVFPFTRPHT